MGDEDGRVSKHASRVQMASNMRRMSRVETRVVNMRRMSGVETRVVNMCRMSGVETRVVNMRRVSRC